jgi:TRAP-type C4-dicarboxylate transport system permease small subunit
VGSAAEGFSRFLGELPSFGKFLAGTGSALFALAALVFFLRKTPLFVFLRREIERLLALLVAGILLAMVVLSALQILLRNLLDTGFLWIDPLLRHLVLLLAFSGALIATGLKRHVQINVLGRFLKGSARQWVGAVIAMLSAAICVALAHAGLALLSDELELSEVVFLSIPSWVVVAIFPLSFLALAFRFALLFCLELAGEAPVSSEDLPRDSPA